MTCCVLFCFTVAKVVYFTLPVREGGHGGEADAAPASLLRLWRPVLRHHLPGDLSLLHVHAESVRHPHRPVGMLRFPSRPPTRTKPHSHVCLCRLERPPADGDEGQSRKSFNRSVLLGVSKCKCYSIYRKFIDYQMKQQLF